MQRFTKWLVAVLVLTTMVTQEMRPAQAASVEEAGAAIVEASDLLELTDMMRMCTLSAMEGNESLANELLDKYEDYEDEMTAADKADFQSAMNDAATAGMEAADHYDAGIGWLNSGVAHLNAAAAALGDNNPNLAYSEAQEAYLDFEPAYARFGFAMEDAIESWAYLCDAQIIMDRYPIAMP